MVSSTRSTVATVALPTTGTGTDDLSNRAADALQAARIQPTRIRYGPERLGPER